MSITFDTMPTPATTGYSLEQRAAVAFELRTLVIALHERAGVLHAGCESRALMAITELNQVADLFQRRAAVFEEQD